MGRWDYPQFLQFAPSDNCNAHCVYCLMHNPESAFRPQMTMSLTLIEKIMSQVVGWPGLAAILPHGWGEPLADSRFPEVVKIIRKYSQAQFIMFTNGSLYERREWLMNPGECNITISAASPETYEHIYGTHLYGQAVKTAEWLREQPNHPRITMRFVICRENMHELDAWRRQWRDYPQVVTCAHVGTYPGDPRRKHAPPPEMFINDLFAQSRGSPCAYYSNLHIAVNGDMNLCCMSEATNGLTFGNVNDTPLLDIWRARCANKMQNPQCQSCQYRGDDWASAV